MSTDSAGRILDAVLTLLSRHGIGGVSMRAVAREAGVALGPLLEACRAAP